MKTTQKGFTVVETLLVVIIAILVGFGGYYVWHTNHKVSPEAIVKAPTAQKTTQPAATTQTIPSTQGYLVIKEWGIKVKLGAADPNKVTYSLSGSGEDPNGANTGSAHLSLASSVTTDPTCQDLGISIVRRNSDTNSNDKQLGTNWYGLTGSPYACGNAQLDAIRQQYTGNNPSTWEYSTL